MITPLTDSRLSIIGNYLNLNNVRRKALYNSLKNIYSDINGIYDYYSIIRDINTGYLRFACSELKRETNALKLCTEDIENDSCMNEESYKGVAFHKNLKKRPTNKEITNETF